MSNRHSSVQTKGEYADKHERHIATKMANIWEQKIGSDTTHSPRTVQDSTADKRGDNTGARISLTTAGKASAVAKVEKMKEMQEDPNAETGNLQKKNTKEIVNSFERMASKTESGVGVPPRYGKKKSIVNSGTASHTSSSSKSGDSPMPRGDKGDLYALIEKLNREVAGMSTTLSVLKSKIDGL